VVRALLWAAAMSLRALSAEVVIHSDDRPLSIDHPAPGRAAPPDPAPPRGARLRGVAVALLGGLVACSVGETWDQQNLDTLVGHDGFTRINARPFASALGAPGVDIDVDPASVAAYRRIDPDRTGSGAQLPRGAMIVRTVLDARGQVTRLTMMVKGPPGYDPTLGDWWFAVTDPDGVPVSEGGLPLIGALAACHECHIDRASDDFLFGVRAADR